MPRKRPGAIRAERTDEHRPQTWACELAPVDRLSVPTSAAVHVAELTSRSSWHISPGVTERMLRRYRAFLDQPGGRLELIASECPACPGCQYDDIAVCRDALEDVVAALPPRAAGELRRVLDRLDTRFLRRTWPNPVARQVPWRAEPHRWWLRRAYQGDHGW